MYHYHYHYHNNHYHYRCHHNQYHYNYHHHYHDQHQYHDHQHHHQHHQEYSEYEHEEGRRSAQKNFIYRGKSYQFMCLFRYPPFLQGLIQAPRARGSTEGRENDWKSLICRENDAFPYAFLIETHEKSVKMTCFLLLFWAAFMKNRWKWLVSLRCFERHSQMSLYEPLQKWGYKFE